MKKTFTFIEILVVTGIVLFFSGIGLARFNNYAQELKLKNEAKKIIDVFELAKKKALSADLFDKNCSDFTGYRITVSSASYLLSFGCSSIYSGVLNYTLDNNSNNITVVTGTGTGNYDFPPLMINPAFAGDKIRLKNSAIGKCVTISISPIGVIELDETLVVC